MLDLNHDLKIEKDHGIIYGWYQEKSREEIEDIMTSALYVVIKKEFSNILIDPITREMKLASAETK